jgi:serine/threonine protein kinase
MPDTPIQVRKIRERQLAGGGGGVNDNNNNHRSTAAGGVFSSRYGGLEKELSSDNNNNGFVVNGSYLIPPPPPPPAPQFGIGMYSGAGSGAATGATTAANADSDNNGDAPIHEGPDCEKLLHQKYQLGEAMGVGSTSTVHRCVLKQQQPNNSNSQQQEYACKIIDCQLIEERFHGMLAQFQREIEALRQLNHPGIIRLYDVYMTPHKIYIVMELMEGGELFDYVVQKGTLTEEEASQIVRKVTSALVYMHDKNIVHRDLKPENLLLKKKPSNPAKDCTAGAAVDVKIIDFGLSKVSVCVCAVCLVMSRVQCRPGEPALLSKKKLTRFDCERFECT